MTTAITSNQPRVTDNDKGVIHVSVNGHRVRDWIYGNDAERRRMMSEARWYVEGWGDSRDAALSLQQRVTPPGADGPDPKMPAAGWSKS